MVYTNTPETITLFMGVNWVNIITIFVLIFSGRLQGLFTSPQYSYISMEIYRCGCYECDKNITCAPDDEIDDLLYKDTNIQRMLSVRMESLNVMVLMGGSVNKKTDKTDYFFTLPSLPTQTTHEFDFRPVLITVPNSLGIYSDPYNYSVVALNYNYLNTYSNVYGDSIFSRRWFTIICRASSKETVIKYSLFTLVGLANRIGGVWTFLVISLGTLKLLLEKHYFNFL